MAEMTHQVVLERDESGAWLARVPAVPGCHTYGRTLEQARRRIREALGLWIEGADDADLAFEVHLPAEVRRELTRAHALRERSERAQRDARDALSVAAVDLTARFGLSRRDAAELLGLSHQRVQQLVDARSDH